MIDIVLPVYNEERRLEKGVTDLHGFLKENVTQPWRIIIASNGSTDGTVSLAQALCRHYPEVTLTHMVEKGRGKALKKALLDSTADVISYMDIDLSTDLEAFPKLLQALDDGSDIAIGSRHLPTSRVERSFKREVVSRLYNLLVRALFWTGIKDAQCGFKAFRRPLVQEVVPLVRNEGWFFDTELLMLAESRGYRVKEVPVRWREDRDSRVNVVKTAMEDIKGLLRLRFGLWRGHG